MQNLISPLSSFGSQCARCASSLVLGEYGAGGVSNATRAAVTAAGKLGGPIHVLLAGVGAKAAAASAAQVAGVSKVLYSEEAAVSHGLAEGLALLLQALQAKSRASRCCSPYSAPGVCSVHVAPCAARA